MYVGVVVGRLTGCECPTGSLATSSVAGCASGSCGLIPLGLVADKGAGGVAAVV